MSKTMDEEFPAIGSIWLNNKKQALYKVRYAGTHTETGEALVVYQGIGTNAPIDPSDAWCRPLAMWREKFTEVPRFPSIQQ